MERGGEEESEREREKNEHFLRFRSLIVQNREKEGFDFNH